MAICVAICVAICSGAITAQRAGLVGLIGDVNSGVASEEANWFQGEAC